MKRIVLIGAAVAGLFTAGITAVASAATGSRYVSVNVTKLKKDSNTVACAFTVTTVAPSGSSGVTAGSTTGTQYGNTFCKDGYGSGATRTVYAENAAGDLTGKIQHWFKGGSVFGKFTLAAQAASGPPTTTTFGAESYSGTVTFTGATGALKGTTGTATMSCSTTDSLHYKCTEKLKLTPPTAVLIGG